MWRIWNIVSPVFGSLMVTMPLSRSILPITPAAGDGTGTRPLSSPGAVSTMSLLTM